MRTLVCASTFLTVTAMSTLVVDVPVMAQPEHEEPGPATYTQQDVEIHTVSPVTARFGGWFQPWTVALIVVVPMLGLLLERHRDIGRYLRSTLWKRRT